MKKFILLVLFVSCSTQSPDRGISSIQDSDINEETSKEELLSALIERREAVKKWMLLCDGEYAGQASTAADKCYQWDMIEFSGNGCLSAELAGDQESVRDRCRDVELGQAEDGQWWRGQSNLGKSTENSFSRDMMYGVINYFISQGHFNKDRERRKEVQARALNWIDWIEFNGEGKQMCNDNKGLTTNSCQLRKSRVLYHTFKQIKALNSANRRYKTIKNLKKGYGLDGWDIEAKFTPVGYQLFLKSHKLYQYYFLRVINSRQYQKVAKIMYKKDPDNPWYEFMYLGATVNNIKKTLERCPITRPTREDWTLPHYTTGDYQFQRATRDRAWEVASGHDCITLLNWQIAYLKNNVDLPFVKAVSSCGSKKDLGIFGGKKVCKPRILNNISKVKCDKKNGFAWTKDGKKYCIWDMGNYYQANDLKGECPSGHKNIGEHEGLPLCEKKHLAKVKLFNCTKKGTGEYLGTASHLVKDASGNVTDCYVYKDTWYQKRKVGRYCPPGMKYENELISKWAPVCKSPKRISKKNCKKPKKYNIARDHYCLVRKKGWFSKRNYTKECPFLTWHTGDGKDGKPLCKPFFHTKIKKRRCNKKGGEVFGKWCIWDKGDHYKARRLR